MHTQFKILVLPIILLTALFSCQQKVTVANKASLALAQVPYSHTGQFLTIESQETWAIEVDYAEGVDSWCQISPTEGVGSNPNIVLSYEVNTTRKAKEASIKVFFKKSNETITLSLKQLFNEDQPDPSLPIAVPQWRELPTTYNAGDLLFVTHRTDILGKNVRNYSIQYDKKNKIALWVAFPLNDSFLGSTKRTDAWGYDPKIPIESQPNLEFSFYTMTGLSGYDRGHQVSSGSRTCTYNANAQTFYYSNMTAQSNDLNSGIWEKLERKERDSSYLCDTLYVVTGPVLTTTGSPDIDPIKDKSGNFFTAKPKAYFKVLLKYTISGNKYSAIGFWFENKGYTHEYPETSDTFTVAEIEKRTGIQFFTNLNLSESELTKLKSEYNPKSWGI